MRRLTKGWGSVKEYGVKHGGLLRCCLQTLDDAMVAAEQPPQEGDRLRCAYCKDEAGMVFKGGAWQWAQELPPLTPRR